MLKINGEPGAVRPRFEVSANQQVVDTQACSRDFVNRPVVDGNASGGFCTEAIGIDTTPRSTTVPGTVVIERPS